MAWNNLGELTVRKTWQLFPASTSSEIFRIKTNILDLTGWNGDKLRSAAYLEFVYFIGESLISENKPKLILVEDDEQLLIEAFPLPLKDVGVTNRNIQIRLSSRYVEQASEAAFAQWSMSIDELV